MAARSVIIYGAGSFGRIVLADIKRYGTLNPVAFVVDREYLSEEFIDGIPVVTYECAVDEYPSSCYDMLVACSYRHMRERAGLYYKAKSAGYNLINYISPGALIDDEIEMGDNNIILAGSIIGHEGKLGSDNIIRQKVYLGHNFTVGDHNIISVGCTIGGFSHIGSLCYIGLSTTMADKKCIGDECLIGMGSIVTRDIESNATAYGNPAKIVSYHESSGVIIG